MPPGADLHEDDHRLQSGTSVNDQGWYDSLGHGLSIDD